MADCPFPRYGIVRGARSRSSLEAYLPEGYRVLHETDGVFVIGGRDEAGWTLDGYVIPRCASGLIWVEEIDLSHPVMKEVPVGA